MKNTIGKLMSSKISLKIDQDGRTGGASINKKTSVFRWLFVENWG